MKTEVTFSSKMENINIVEKIVEELSMHHKLGDEIYGNILVACVEAVNNAITHGNRLDETKNVHVKVLVQNNSINVCVRDEGKGFDCSNIPDPTLPENIEKPHGRGIFLINHLADEVKFNINGTEVEMTFNLA